MKNKTLILLVILTLTLTLTACKSGAGCYTDDSTTSSAIKVKK